MLMCRLLREFLSQENGKFRVNYSAFRGGKVHSRCCTWKVKNKQFLFLSLVDYLYVWNILFSIQNLCKLKSLTSASCYNMQTFTFSVRVSNKKFSRENSSEGFLISQCEPQSCGRETFKISLLFIFYLFVYLKQKDSYFFLCLHSLK